MSRTAVASDAPIAVWRLLCEASVCARERDAGRETVWSPWVRGPLDRKMTLLLLTSVGAFFLVQAIAQCFTTDFVISLISSIGLVEAMSLLPIALVAVCNYC